MRNLTRWIGLGIVALVMVTGGAGQADAGIVLTFDDVATTPGNVTDLTNYDGFTFTNSGVIDAATFGNFQGLPQSAVSSPNSLINEFIGQNGFASTDNSVFSFNSGYFTSFDGNGTPLVITGELNGVVTGSQSFTITDTAPTFITLDQSIFGQVNEVSFNNSPNALALDNLSINGGAVPEPSSLALCTIAGVIGLAVARVRRKRTA
jgi:hypothetical protein